MTFVFQNAQKYYASIFCLVYIQILWSVLIGLFVFNEYLNLLAIIGALLIILSGIFSIPAQYNQNKDKAEDYFQQAFSIYDILIKLYNYNKKRSKNNPTTLMNGSKILAIEYYLPKKIENNKALKKFNPKLDIKIIK